MPGLNLGTLRAAILIVCPVCGYVQSARTFLAVGAPLNAVGISCVGRWMDKRRRAFGESGRGPCDYAGGGLFRLNPVEIEGREINAMAFAGAEVQGGNGN